MALAWGQADCKDEEDVSTVEGMGQDEDTSRARRPKMKTEAFKGGLSNWRCQRVPKPNTKYRGEEWHI